MANYQITYEEVLGWIRQSCTHVSADSLELLTKARDAETNPGAVAM